MLLAEEEERKAREAEEDEEIEEQREEEGKGDEEDDDPVNRVLGHEESVFRNSEFPPMTSGPSSRRTKPLPGRTSTESSPPKGRRSGGSAPKSSKKRPSSSSKSKRGASDVISLQTQEGAAEAATEGSGIDAEGEIDAEIPEPNNCDASPSTSEVILDENEEGDGGEEEAEAEVEEEKEDPNDPRNLEKERIRQEALWRDGKYRILEGRRFSANVIF